MDKFEKTFAAFKKYYKPIPLETFGKNPFKTLVSTFLSSRTLDVTTHLAVRKLFDKAPTVRKLSEINIKSLRELIYPVGFYNRKARQLTRLAKIILKEFKGEIPETREELMTLPGVGRKTANLVLNRAFAKPAIAVDTHVHKIVNILGWIKTKTPEETEIALQKILPRKYWRDTNRLLVSIGQQYRGRKLKVFLLKNKLL
ncbi:hypothetical protein A3E15_01215 [Candidatus Woesebacteria bacterium RIFCSPHIGHO2_12_FULL_42_9]|uniref:HhH-GPD domain-containing protein n=2 Tax=Candidatus Woeseibacteriota TaxID=1752722 RepID=A0A1F8ARZ5_9BACT|nr:MAG: DNA-(Apurinic or apyrimidinic site) lyase [Candidatus Woesebacteria bacterium GW2011_GWA1_39_12]OGM54536.1 MAG: hypothetical protein A3E15_01215 [Candidatus Woesebacteria bacterium RIFCSPHIGHO2_12_FULL_42_9]